jgi:chaperone required for assembly of F1-ATPase
MSTKNDDLASAIFIDGGERDPIRLAARDGRRTLPKRFYSKAEAAPVAEGFAVMLDGKPVRTPARSALVLPTLALAQAIAAEWDAQGELLDPNTMPLTR